LQAQLSPHWQSGPQAHGWQLQLSFEQGLDMGWLLHRVVDDRNL